MSLGKKQQKTTSHSSLKKSPDEQNLEQIENLIERLPEEKRLQVIKQQISSFEGPLPAPQDFHEYDKILPGAAERIMRMAEEEQRIRKTDKRNFFIHRQTQLFLAWSISIGILSVAALATWLGEAIIAIPLGIAGIASVIINLIREK